MFKNERGFGTSEALIAVSSVFMVMGLFLPMVFSVMSALDKKENNLTAARVLYEHLEEEMFAGKAESDRYQRMGKEYQVNTSEEKICVTYEVYRGESENLCLKEGTGE